MTTTTSAITTDELSKRYGDIAALDGLTLDVPAGSIFGFLGPNGAGKTTALKILAGLTRSSGGTATINGVPVDLEGTHRSQLGYLAQEPRFYGWMSGRQTIEYVMRFFPATPGRHRVDELLDLVGLADAADRPTGAYSGGMRQRLGIAQALAGDPAVVLLDEPAAALDPLGRHDVLALLERLRGTKTVFYSTHILDDVQRVSDHVAILDRGRLVTSAPTGELMRRATSGSVRVALVGDARDAATALADLPGVLSVNPAGRAGDEWRFDLHLGESLPEVVQRGVMGFAVDHDLIVTSNHQESADLESVFLKIVNEERAA